MSLIFDNVSFRYGPTGQGIEQLNLTVQPGELLAIIGASGSGKSTLLRLTAGLLTGHQGSITLSGRDLSQLPVHQRKIGMVFQSYALFPHLDALNNVAYGLKMRGVSLTERTCRAREMLELVDLAQFADRYPAKLSGGQQQRVALARALAFGPQALLLDEPLAALDASIRGVLRDQIRTLQQRFNATTLFVTHDQEEALSVADRVAIMEHGRLVQVDTPRGLYERPVNKSVARFVGLSSLFEARVLEPGLLDAGFARLHADTGARAVGSAVCVLIRPEYLQVDPPQESVNRIRGALGVVRYLGGRTRYDFTPDGTQTILLGEAMQPPARAVAIAPEHLQLLDA